MAPMRDSARDTAVRRVHMKLCALAYVGTRHGTDACPEFTEMATAMLCGAAIGYVAALTGKSLDVRPRLGTREVHQLELAAITYDRARHGTDSHTEFTRAAVAMLCQAAVAYVEALTGTSAGVDARVLNGEG
jgi:hypothetical protein